MEQTEKPLVWTTHGNFPAHLLAYSTRWDDTPEYTKLTETYRLGDEIVRESVHVMIKQGLPLNVEQQKI